MLLLWNTGVSLWPFRAPLYNVAVLLILRLRPEPVLYWNHCRQFVHVYVS